ncbi:hypothetical protein QFC21_007029 [Naganishia friedmannii]|uniref:Uncharacterized protein n=1 Tax=Naganishia friedmannii TaxID=89922 RepID=A0ACC2UZM4_9TREE|nr:hypothetical protein QFC21_007029 [Naganishia friedmannii]
MAESGEVFEETCPSKQTPRNLTALINGVSIAVRQNFFLLSIWVKPQPEGFFESDDGINAVRQLGIAFKTDVLGYPSSHHFTSGTHGYTTEVEFQRHSKGKSKKALRKTKLKV